jgi:glucose-1-phosphate cytidylyltransferase
MKVVILAGGLGTRLAEETTVRPKPMVEIGGMPILWHIMKIYSRHGLYDFIICLGHKGYVIKEFFHNYCLHNSDVTFDFINRTSTFHQSRTEPWQVTLVDTGMDSQTGGRLKRVAPYLNPAEDFCMTYGDGVADIDIAALIAFHRQAGLAATMTVVRPPARFGATAITGNVVTDFVEKPDGEGGYINGGFFVLAPSVLDLIEGDATIWEAGPLTRLAGMRQLAAYRHDGFWMPMDTVRDRNTLEQLYSGNRAPWRSW